MEVEVAWLEWVEVVAAVLADVEEVEVVEGWEMAQEEEVVGLVELGVAVAELHRYEFECVMTMSRSRSLMDDRNNLTIRISSQARWKLSLRYSPQDISRLLFCDSVS